MSTSPIRPTRAELLHDVVEIVRSKAQSVDIDFAGEIQRDTRILRDLDFESVAVVELCMAIGKHFRAKLPFQQLVFRDGKFQDFSVADMVDFVEQNLSS